MSALNCDPCYGSLMVNGEDLARPNTCLPDLSELWMGPAGRGGNTLIPHKGGRRAEFGIVDETRYTFTWLVTGQVTDAGVPVDEDGWPDQLEAAWGALYAAVVFPTLSGAAVDVPLVWTLPSGATRTSDAQVYRPSALLLLPGSIIRTTLDLTVPLGDLYV